MKKLFLLLIASAACNSILAANPTENPEAANPVFIDTGESPYHPEEQGRTSYHSSALKKSENSNVRFNLDVGLMCLTGAIADNTFQETGIHARTGFMVGGDICRMFTPNFGAGIKINYRNLSNTMYGQYAHSEKFTANYFFAGPQILLRTTNRTNTGGMICGFSIGYATTSQKAGYYNFSTDTFGMVLDFGYEFGISDNSAVQLKLSMIAASSKINDELRENMSSVNLTLGIVFGR